MNAVPSAVWVVISTVDGSAIMRISSGVKTGRGVAVGVGVAGRGVAVGTGGRAVAVGVGVTVGDGNGVAVPVGRGVYVGGGVLVGGGPDVPLHAIETATIRAKITPIALTDGRVGTKILRPSAAINDIRLCISPRLCSHSSALVGGRL